MGVVVSESEGEGSPSPAAHGPPSPAAHGPPSPGSSPLPVVALDYNPHSTLQRTPTPEPSERQLAKAEADRTLRALHAANVRAAKAETALDHATAEQEAADAARAQWATKTTRWIKSVIDRVYKADYKVNKSAYEWEGASYGHPYQTRFQAQWDVWFRLFLKTGLPDIEVDQINSKAKILMGYTLERDAVGALVNDWKKMIAACKEKMLSPTATEFWEHINAVVQAPEKTTGGDNLIAINVKRAVAVIANAHSNRQASRKLVRAMLDGVADYINQINAEKDAIKDARLDLAVATDAQRLCDRSHHEALGVHIAMQLELDAEEQDVGGGGAPPRSVPIGAHDVVASFVDACARNGSQ